MKRTILYNNIDGRLQSNYHNDDEPDGGISGPFVPLEETLISNSNSHHSDHTAALGMNHNAPISPPSVSKKSIASTLSVGTKKGAPTGTIPPSSSVLPSAASMHNSVRNTLRMATNLNAKKVISSSVFSFIFLLVWDSLLAAPEDRVLQPNFANTFLIWVQAHPAAGLIWILLVMSVAVIFMIPIGTPLTLGCGYIYKGAYGWQLGVLIATCVSMLGSALGAVVCFLLGRYLMRDVVKKWIRKYPIFDAIDVAAAEHGFRIMAMLYLTPILPLGPVSYMCGTTSLKLSHFLLAKIAALPLMMLYVLIGASTGTLISTSKNGESMDQVKSIEENETLIIAGILLSFASIAGITHYIKKELSQVLERQKRDHRSNEAVPLMDSNSNSVMNHHHLKNDMEMATASNGNGSSNATSGVGGNFNDVPVTPTTTMLEMGNVATAPRQRKH
jgi:uncharacterized membrane protein YdjX (TVP38/TMEM64 family)